MYRELLPDRLRNLWESVEKGLLSSEEFHKCQELYTELMWWHTLIEDLSPLAYVVALHFARLHGCGNYLISAVIGGLRGGLLFAKSGIKATLADISSAALDFSSWRFSKRGLSARHIDLKECALPENSFDFITAMDVFEHLVQPEKTAHDLWKALRPGGFLFGRFHAEADEDRPHHITLDFGPTLAALASLGFSRVWQDQWLWGHEVFQT